MALTNAGTGTIAATGDRTSATAAQPVLPPAPHLAPPAVPALVPAPPAVNASSLSRTVSATFLVVPATP